MKVYMLPTPTTAKSDLTNSIHQIVLKLASNLVPHGVIVTENRDEADLVVAHAGQTDGIAPCDVAHVHGLYPTAHYHDIEWHWSANASVINNVKHARHITTPSQWVSDLFSRDMHLNSTVVGWGIDVDEWDVAEHQGYVLWNKTRADGVCNPQPLVDLARKANRQLFLTTFGYGTSNIRTTGRVPFEQMKEMIRHAQVYLATTKETFGIGTLEAMACGIPVLGFRWGATTDIVAHGVTGYLAEPNNIDDLYQGLEYCIANRAVLGANARKVAEQYSWAKVAKQFAGIYRQVLAKREGPKVSVIIPCHNYARFVDKAISSVLEQKALFDYELIVIDDASDDDSLRVIRRLLDTANIECGYDQVNFGNPSDTRNHGIHMARGEYIVCLDADDTFGSDLFLQKLADALDADQSLGIAFTSLKMISEDGSKWAPSNWPEGYDFEKQIMGSNQVPTCCMFRKVAWQRAGGFRREYVPAEDADLWTRIAILGFGARHAVTEPWFNYRFHDSSLSAPTRNGKKPAINWHLDKHTKHVPFACDGNPKLGSWPVRNYDQPLATFIIPVGPYHIDNVARALDSIERQTEYRWEIVVVNDSGTELVDLVKSYPFIRVVNTSGGCGASFARNRGIEAATAPLVSFLDADDVIDPRYLEISLVAHQRTGRYVYSDWYSRTQGGGLESHETPIYDPAAVFRSTSIHAINVLIPKKFCTKVGGFDESMHTWEDVDFFMKLAVAGFCGVRVNKPLITYDYNTGQLREKGEPIKEELKALLRSRYGEYMEGRKVCGCISGGEFAGQGATPSGSMVKIEYFGAVGTHQVTGIATKSDYGRRSRGDVFYVDQKDIDANREDFIPLMDIMVTEQEPVPAVPELI